MQLLDQLVGRELDTERPQPVREPVDEGRRVLDELVEPGDHGGDDQGDQEDDRPEQDQEDQSGGGPPLPPTRREVVDPRLQGEGQEERDPEHRQEAAQLIDQVEEDEDRDPGGEECEPQPLAGQLDRFREPRRHRSVGGLDPLHRGLGLEILGLVHDACGGYPAGAAAARPQRYEVMAAAISSKLST